MCIRDRWRIVSGQMPDSELLHIAESEELAAVARARFEVRGRR